ncbi:hypothetical protein HYQ44_000204 [Verticillium longisporum]|nr:hypothetical protein HYQ44_000204 [Verticillium longisporum]
MIGSIDHGSARLVSSTFTLNLILNRSPRKALVTFNPTTSLDLSSALACSLPVRTRRNPRSSLAEEAPWQSSLSGQTHHCLQGPQA